MAKLLQGRQAARPFRGFPSRTEAPHGSQSAVPVAVRSHGTGLPKGPAFRGPGAWVVFWGQAKLTRMVGHPCPLHFLGLGYGFGEPISPKCHWTLGKVL